MIHAKRKAFTQLISILLILGLTGCAAQAPANPSAPSSSAESTIEVVDEQPPSAETTLEQVIKALRPVDEEINKALNKDEDVYPTRAQYIKLAEAAAALGVPATSRSAGFGMDMRNYRQVVEFCNALQAGKDAQTAFYDVYPGGVYEYAFRAKGGELTLTTQSWTSGATAPDEATALALDDLKLWENGWMVWHPREEGDATSSYMGLRVQPLGEEAYGLLQKYVWYLQGKYTGVLSHNWDEQHLSRLNWDFVFESLLTQEGVTLGGFGAQGRQVDSIAAFDIPATEVEGRLTRLFPITAEHLHRLPAYNADTQTYGFWGFRGGGYSPKAEVTEKVENPDGSFTLRVDLTAPEFNEEHVSTNYLTIMPEQDGGYRYIKTVTDAKDDNAERWKSVGGSAGILPEDAQ